MSEQPFYFERDGRALFGVFHEAGTADAGDPFVFCHPFGEEKLWTHRVYVAFARRLAVLGMPVLRFDYFGNGDSDGEFEDSSLESALADVGRAVDEVRRLTGASTVSLLGLRLGATIAALAGEERTDVGRLVLWAPVLDGARYMQELLRINLTSQMAAYKDVRQDRPALIEGLRRGETVSVDGYELSQTFFEECSAVRLRDGAKRSDVSCLTIQIDRTTRPLDAEIERFVATYRRGVLAQAIEEPFWREISRSYQQEAPNLFAVTLDWLRADPDEPGRQP